MVHVDAGDDAAAGIGLEPQLPAEVIADQAGDVKADAVTLAVLAAIIFAGTIGRLGGVALLAGYVLYVAMTPR